MKNFYQIIQLWHIMSFVFMSIPLFNLIVVNERALMGKSFDYGVDRFLENIIRHGAARCYVFQTSAFLSGILLLLNGSLGVEALWANQILLAKFIILAALMSLLSYVHFSLQPKIESYFAQLTPGTTAPDNFLASIRPYRIKRKNLATLCLFLVLTTIILGMQVYAPFTIFENVILMAVAALFAFRANRTLIFFGWV